VQKQLIITWDQDAHGFLPKIDSIEGKAMHLEATKLLYGHLAHLLRGELWRMTHPKVKFAALWCFYQSLLWIISEGCSRPTMHNVFCLESVGKLCSYKFLHPRWPTCQRKGHVT
jgi:hypothetical protein